MPSQKPPPPLRMRDQTRRSINQERLTLWEELHALNCRCTLNRNVFIATDPIDRKLADRLSAPCKNPYPNDGRWKGLYRQPCKSQHKGHCILASQ